MVSNMYQKEIIYMNLFEKNNKISCVGYLKQEKKHENISIELQVKSVPNKFTGNFAIRIQGISGWKEPGSLTINGGSGIWTGSVSEPVIKAEVLLSDSYRIKGESRNVQPDAMGIGTRQEVRQVNNQVKDNKENKYSAATAEIGENKQPEVSEEIEENKHYGANVEVNKNRDTVAYETVKENKLSNNHTEIIANQNRHSDAGIIKADLENKEQLKVINNTRRSSKVEASPLYESKWEQLLSAYEQIHPYGDNRTYIKLEPKDFIVLRSNYQHLVNNSFLLHGFYNYRYVILGKEKDYYIGVPGVFYEREKMVALMFGFEAFECEGGEAEEGKFGYYLRKVEI
ncbi:MAG: hypothetical protein K2K46_11010 [Lachnospiraceae bacterium]|nr:hypothetical protein [Lachnospiraceae bacterium]